MLLDTRGPEIRIKDFEKGEAVLPDGGMFTITTRDVPGNENIVSVTYDDLPKEVAKGNHIMINDGKVILQVREVKGCDVVCDIIHGGKLSNHKGVNLPNINISMEYLSDQDKSDILFGIENDVDYISASFIRSAADVNDVRKLLNENGGSDIKIIAKIESTQGIENFEEILQAADGIMASYGVCSSRIHILERWHCLTILLMPLEMLMCWCWQTFMRQERRISIRFLLQNLQKRSRRLIRTRKSITWEALKR